MAASGDKNTLIRRSDGEVFAYACHRTEFSAGAGASEIEEALEDAADLHGGYALLRKNEDDSVSATVSAAAGTPIGEAVLALFPGREHIVWCETINDETGEALLVIIAEGRVRVDSLIPPVGLDRSAMSVIVTSQVPFDVYVHGDAPIVSPDELAMGDRANMQLSAESVATFTRLPEPLFPKLVADPEIALLPISNAMTAAKLNPPYLRWAMIACVVCASLYFGVANLLGGSEKNIAPQVIDNFAGYRAQMVSPTPSNILLAMQEAIVEGEASLGWGVANVTYSQDVGLEMDILELGGALIQTRVLLNDLGWQTQIMNNGLSARKEFSGNMRPEANTIFNIDDAMAKTKDELDFSGGLLERTGAPVFDGYIYRNDVTIKASVTTMPDVEYLGFILDEAPAVINKMKFTRTSDGETVAEIEATFLGVR